MKGIIVSNFSTTAVNVSPPKTDVILLQEIGLTRQQRDELLSEFNQLTASSDSKDEMQLTSFVMSSSKKGTPPRFADAAFRTFSSQNNVLNKFEYIVAAVSLHCSEANFKNKAWLRLRRKIVFNLFNISGVDSLCESDLDSLLSTLSTTVDEPEFYGISNSHWGEANKEKDNDLENDTLISKLAISRQQYAEKQMEFENLQLDYIKLEKKLCETKLLLAVAQAKK